MMFSDWVRLARQREGGLNWTLTFQIEFFSPFCLDLFILMEGMSFAEALHNGVFDFVLCLQHPVFGSSL